jgi:hypothetical protein
MNNDQELGQTQDGAIAFLKNIAEILPAAMLTADHVAVLKEYAEGLMQQKALIDALGVDPEQLKKDKGLTKAYDKDGKQLFGRGVEKSNLNVRMDKPLVAVLEEYCDTVGMTKTDVLRQVIFTHLYSANIARQKEKRLGLGDDTGGD